MTIELNKIYNCDVTEGIHLPDESVNCVVTSPPYWGLRDYGVDGQIGLEKTPEEYIDKIVNVFREVWRVLRKDGTVFLNLGDSYNGSGKAGKKDSEYFNKHTEFGKPAKNKDKIGIPTNIKGLKPKDLIGVPWMVAFALRADGWYLRQDIIWHKPNPMPESVTDRCTKAHEYIFLLSKSAKYYCDMEAIQEEATGYDGRKDIFMKGSAKYEDSGQTFAKYGKHIRWKRKYNDSDMGGAGTGFDGRSGYSNLDNPYVRNKRSVWSMPTQSFKEAHFATFPEDLITPCILAGCPEGGIVLDPFMGSGTTALVALKYDRNFVGCELNPDYIKMAEKRIEPYLLQGKLNFNEV